MRSDTVKKGIQQAPHRSLFNALGLTEEELQKPLIGTISARFSGLIIFRLLPSPLRIFS